MTYSFIANHQEMMREKVKFPVAIQLGKNLCETLKSDVFILRGGSVMAMFEFKEGRARRVIRKSEYERRAIEIGLKLISVKKLKSGGEG